MSTTQDLVTALKHELKAAPVTYADLAEDLRANSRWRDPADPRTA